MGPITAMTIEARQLLLLLNWMSPAFPAGSFAYSHWLEWAIEARIVSNAPEIKSWIEDLLTRGSGWNGAVVFSQCWENDAEALNELALALASSKERYLETTQLGRAFEIAASIFDNCHPRTGSGDDSISVNDIAYPVAVGLACRRLGILAVLVHPHDRRNSYRRSAS